MPKILKSDFLLRFAGGFVLGTAALAAVQPAVAGPLTASVRQLVAVA